MSAPAPEVTYRFQVTHEPDGPADSLPWTARVAAFTADDAAPTILRVLWRHTQEEAEQAARAHVAWLREQPQRDEPTWVDA